MDDQGQGWRVWAVRQQKTLYWCPSIRDNRAKAPGPHHPCMTIVSQQNVPSEAPGQNGLTIPYIREYQGKTTC
jgi:hypothetical protein